MDEVQGRGPWWGAGQRPAACFDESGVPRVGITISAQDARQGTAPGIVRYVLAISVTLAVVAMIVVLLLQG
jgi:hypothetical protein